MCWTINFIVLEAAIKMGGEETLDTIGTPGRERERERDTFTTQTRGWDKWNEMRNLEKGGRETGKIESKELPGRERTEIKRKAE